MAFKMNPGRSPFMKTGRGIPTPFMQSNAGTGEDLSAQARAKAEAEAKAKLAALGENKGTSKDVRNVEATATVTKEGKKVEKFAKTPEEIKKWKAASAENKAKYEKQSATETVKLSDVGKDSPAPPATVPPAEKPKSFGNWYKTGTAGNNTGFGGSSESGWTNDPSFVSSSEQKDYIDKYEGKNVINNNMASSSQNSFNMKPVTPEEDRISRFYGTNAVSPYNDAWSDKGNPGSGEAKRQEYIKNSINRIDTKLADKKAAEERVKNKFEETKKRILAEKASRRKPAEPVAMQLKKKAKAPAKMKKY